MLVKSSEDSPKTDRCAGSLKLLNFSRKIRSKIHQRFDCCIRILTERFSTDLTAVFEFSLKDSPRI